MKIKIIIGVAAFALFIAGAAFAYNELRGGIEPELMIAEQPGSIPEQQDTPSEPDENESAEPERIEAPDFTAEDSDGGSVKLSGFEGTPVVLNFWASWCPPCKAEMPAFDEAYTELGDRVSFMMVNMTDGQRETKGKGAAYVSEQGFTFPVYYDTEQQGAYAYGIRSIPTTIFIDGEGFIIAVAEGLLDEATLRYGISLLLPEDDE